jgi:hypothetical protein
MSMDLEHLEALAGVVATATADEGHRLLHEVVERESTMPMQKAVAIEIAHRTKAWEHDNGDYVRRYELAMREEGFRSMLPAYCWVEYGLRESTTWMMATVGELLLSASSVSTNSRHLDRASITAVRPLATRAVLTQNDPEVLARTLEIAGELADEEITAAQQNAGLVPKITGAHIKKAMVKAGVVVPRPPTPDPDEAAATATEKRRAQREATTTRVDRDLRWLVQNNYAAAARDAAVLCVKLLSDQPKMLDDITEAIQGVRS